nr:hypothetical protein [Stenotrophomonas geniculata]
MEGVDVVMVSDGSAICNTFGYLLSLDPPKALHAVEHATAIADPHHRRLVSQSARTGFRMMAGPFDAALHSLSNARQGAHAQGACMTEADLNEMPRPDATCAPQAAAATFSISATTPR